LFSTIFSRKLYPDFFIILKIIMYFLNNLKNVIIKLFFSIMLLDIHFLNINAFNHFHFYFKNKEVFNFFTIKIVKFLLHH